MWVIYLAAGKTALAWAAFIILLPVAVLGFTMFVRWISVYRRAGDGGSAAVTPDRYTTGGVARTATATPATEPVPAERHLPVTVVVAHGVLAAATLLLVLLTAIGIGGS